MKCIEQTLLMDPSCVVCECCTPGHAYMARCIRLLYRSIRKELLVAGCKDCDAPMLEFHR